MGDSAYDIGPSHHGHRLITRAFSEPDDTELDSPRWLTRMGDLGASFRVMAWNLDIHILTTHHWHEC